MSIRGAIVLLVSTARSVDDRGRGRPPQPGAYPQQAAGDDADGKHRNKDPQSGGHTAIVRLRHGVRALIALTEDRPQRPGLGLPTERGLAVLAFHYRLGLLTVPSTSEVADVVGEPEINAHLNHPRCAVQHLGRLVSRDDLGIIIDHLLLRVPKN